MTSARLEAMQAAADALREGSRWDSPDAAKARQIEQEIDKLSSLEEKEN